MTDIILRSPESNLLIALTKCDLVSEEEKLQLKDSFKTNVLPFLQKEADSLSFNIAHLDDDNASKHASTVLQKFKDIKESIEDNSIIHLVSCSSLDGFTPIRRSILKIIESEECKVAIPRDAHQLYVQLGKLGIASNQSSTLEPEKNESITHEPEINEPVETAASAEPIPQEQIDAKTPKKPFMQRFRNLFRKKKSNTKSSEEKGPTTESVIEEDIADDLVKAQALIHSHGAESIDVKSLHQESPDSHTLEFISFTNAKSLLRGIVTKKSKSYSDEEITTALRKYLSILHAHGLIIWYNASEELENFIFNNLYSFVDLLKGLFQHDIEDTFSFSTLSTENKVYLMKLGIEKDDYNRFTQKLHEEGLLSVYLLHVFTMKYGFHSHLEGLIAILEHLNLAYLIPSQQPLDGNINKQFLLFPWYIKDITPPNEIEELVSDVKTPSKDFHSLQVNFSGFLPISFFHYLCVLLYKSLLTGRDDQTQSIWKNGIFARINKTQFLVEHCLQHAAEDEIHMYVRNPLDVSSIGHSWQLIQQYLHIIDDLSTNWWPGIVTSKHLICSHCEVTKQEEFCTWNIREHIATTCQMDQISQCKKVKNHSFPSALIYPLPSGIYNKHNKHITHCIFDVISLS